MATEATGRVVFEATHDWWQIVCRREEIETGQTWSGRWGEAAGVADIDPDDPESWVEQVTSVAERHEAIQVGDYVCCQGVGSDVRFVRLS